MATDAGYSKGVCVVSVLTLSASCSSFSEGAFHWSLDLLPGYDTWILQSEMTLPTFPKLNLCKDIL